MKTPILTFDDVLAFGEGARSVAAEMGFPCARCRDVAIVANELCAGILARARETGGEVELRTDVEGGTLTIVARDRGRPLPEAATLVDAEGDVIACRRGSAGNPGSEHASVGCAIGIGALVRLADEYQLVSGDSGNEVAAVFVVDVPAATVLVVEDDALVRRAFARVIRAHGFHVVEALTGEQAVELLAGPGDRPDVVVADVGLPGLLGPHIPAALAARGVVAPPFLFVSGDRRQSLLHSGKLLPDQLFLHKPVTTEALLAAIRRLLHERRARRLNAAAG